MDRKQKIDLIKALLNGKANINDLKPKTNYARLTVNELYLLLTIRQEGNVSGIECLEYYRVLSNSRPVTEPEKRGYPMATDSENYPRIYPGSDEQVKAWYQKLNLQIKYSLK